MTRLAIWLLTRAGWTLIPPKTVRAVIDGYVVGRADSFVTVPIGSTIAPPGARVRLAPEVPRPGLWEPRTGVAARYVVKADARSVTYTSDKPGTHEISLRTWGDWVSRNKATLEACEMEELG